MISNKSYLGDGVYVEFDNERRMLKLTTEDGLVNPTNTIYLEFDIYYALTLYFERLKRILLEAARDNQDASER